MQTRSHGATNTGLVRANNEDAYVVGSWVFAVADGVGGAPAGEVASRIAVDAVAALDAEQPHDADDAATRLTAAVQEAARRVHADQAANPRYAGMGTTLTAAAVWDDRLCIAHVGDSRAYLWRGGGLRQRTRDHTVTAEAVRAGLMDRSEAAHHPRRHTLVRVLGSDPDVPLEIVPPEPVRPGDRLLLCSDGLTEVIDDARIAAVLGFARGPRDAVGRLTREALAAGGPDNVTVIVVVVE